MKLTLVRHGHAHRSIDAAQDIRPNTVWSSPLLRALQTAELLVAGLACPTPVEVITCLEPGGDLGALLARFAELPDDTDLLLTSHEPTCSRLVSILTGTPAPRVHTAEAFRMDLERAEPGGATLTWYGRGEEAPR